MPEPQAPDWARVVRERLPPLGLRPEREAEIAEELALQLDQIWRAALARGTSAAEALASAEAEVGDWQGMAQEIRRAERPLASRLPGVALYPDPPALGASRGELMADLWQDLRYAVRMLARNRGLTAVIVLTLALGIGATTTIFSVVNGLLLAPLPFRDAERLVVVTEIAPEGGRMSVAWPNFSDWQERTRSFEAMSAYRTARFNLTGGEKAERLEGRRVTGNFFDMLGETPQVGRLLAPADDVAGAPDVAVLSDPLWRRRFGGDPSALGRSLMLDGRPFTIVGVLPPGFQYNRPADVYVPLVPAIGDGDRDRGNHMGLYALAHLAPGVGLEQANEEMDVLAAALAQEYPATNSGNGAQVHGLREIMVESIRTALVVLMVAVGCVLLIGCVNLANLLLARGAARASEVAVRLALGASRRRIARQLLTESLLLSVVGGLAGIWLAVEALPLLLTWLPRNVPRLDTVAMDGRVLLFATLVSVGTGFLFGLMPALQASRAGLAGTARMTGRFTSGAGSSRSLPRRLMLVAEIGLAIVLLTTAGLMMRTVMRLVRVDPGIGMERLLTLSLQLSGERYEGEARQVAFREILERVGALPGVESTALTLSLPLDGSNWGSIFILADHPVPARADLPSAAFTPISNEFFRTLGIRQLQGRAFDSTDRPGSPHVVVINETMAKRFWPGQDPIGKRIKQGWPESETPWREVVGVVADVKLEGVDAETPLQAYLPLAHEPMTSLFLVVRTAGEPAPTLRMVEQAMREIDPDVPLYGVRTMQEVFSESIATRRFPTLFLTQFSLAALVLAALGIFGLMSYAVAQRTHEVGVRMALGASGSNVLREVLGEGMRVVAAGVAVGVVGSLAVTRFLRSLLFEVAPTDPVSFAAAVLLLTAVALAAAYLPARRAARVDPMVALRAE